MSTVLKVENLHKSFSSHFFSPKRHVLKGLNFSLPKGSATGFLGANGSGKTSTLKCLLDFIKKDQGEVLFFGQALSIKTKSRIGFLPERLQVYDDLTAYEYLLFLSQLGQPLESKNFQKQQIDYWLKKMDLFFNAHQKLKTFSKGMLQKIGLIQAFLNKPELLLLDEPFSDLDSQGRLQVMSILEDIKKQGATLFFSSHILQDMERLCDRFLILKEGQVVFEGDYSCLSKKTKNSYSLLYFLKGKKVSLQIQSQEECQKQLKHVLSQGAQILSLLAKDSLESFYKKIAFDKK